MRNGTVGGILDGEVSGSTVLVLRNAVEVGIIHEARFDGLLLVAVKTLAHEAASGSGTANVRYVAVSAKGRSVAHGLEGVVDGVTLVTGTITEAAVEGGIDGQGISGNFIVTGTALVGSIGEV